MKTIIRLTTFTNDKEIYLNINNIIAFAQCEYDPIDWLENEVPIDTPYTKIRCLGDKLFKVKEYAHIVELIINGI